MAEDEFFSLEHAHASMASERRIAMETAAARKKQSAQSDLEEDEPQSRISSLFNDRRSA